MRYFALFKIIISEEIGYHRGMIANDHIAVGSNSYEKMKTFKCVGFLLMNENTIHEEIKCRLKTGNSCYYSVQILFSFSKKI